MQITKVSPLTGRENTLDIPVSEEQLARWRLGEGPIQNIMPELTPDQREFLMTGYTKEDWATMFPPEDEDETD